MPMMQQLLASNVSIRVETFNFITNKPFIVNLIVVGVFLVVEFLS